MEKMKKYYLTGVAGMIGSNVARDLLDQDCIVIGVDNFWRGTKENVSVLELYDNFEFRYADISTDLDWANDMLKNDQLIHIADIVAGIGYVFCNEWAVFSENNKINTSIASLLVDKQPERIIYLGTACSYPESMQQSVYDSILSEKDKFPAKPESGYGWSKLMGEIEFKLAIKNSDTRLITLDLHNVYGDPCIYKEDTSQVIPALIWKAISSKDSSLNIWGNGLQGRAFVHTSDVSKAIKLATEYEGDLDNFMIGPNFCTTIKEVANIICSHPLISISEITYDLTKPVGDIGRFANNSLAVKELGWSQEKDINKGIHELIDYILKLEKND